MLHFDRSTVKHGTHNIQNKCHTSGFLTALKCTKFVFRPGLRPGPHWGSLHRSQDPLPALRGPASSGEEKGRVVNGSNRPLPFANSWIRPWHVHPDRGRLSHHSVLQLAFVSSSDSAADSIASSTALLCCWRRLYNEQTLYSIVQKILVRVFWCQGAEVADIDKPTGMGSKSGCNHCPAAREGRVSDVDQILPRHCRRVYKSKRMP